jgi:hypothetical protein
MSNIRGGLVLRKGNIILKEEGFFADKNLELNIDRVFEREQYLIYVSSNDNYAVHMYNINNKIDKKLNSDMSWQIYLSDKCIYYSKMLEWDNLYKIKMDTMEVKRVNYDSTYNMKVCGRRIYYRNESEAGGIFSSDIQGTDRKIITQDIADEININGDFLYYRNRMDEGRLYRLSLDGIQKEKLNDSNTRGITFDKMNSNIVYYSNEDDGGCLYRISLENGHAEKITKFKVRGTIVCEKYIYCRNEDDGGSIYKIDKLNINAVRIKSGDYSFVGVRNGDMYLIDKARDTIIRVNLTNELEEVILDEIGNIYDAKIS